MYLFLIIIQVFCVNNCISSLYHVWHYDNDTNLNSGSTIGHLCPDSFLFFLLASPEALLIGELTSTRVMDILFKVKVVRKSQRDSKPRAVEYTAVTLADTLRGSPSESSLVFLLTWTFRPYPPLVTRHVRPYNKCLLYSLYFITHAKRFYNNEDNNLLYAQ